MRLEGTKLLKNHGEYYSKYVDQQTFYIGTLNGAFRGENFARSSCINAIIDRVTIEFLVLGRY